MQEKERIKALYCVLVGKPYEDRSTTVLDPHDLWTSTEILYHFFAPTDEQIGTLLLYKFGGAMPEEQVSAKAPDQPEEQVRESVPDQPQVKEKSKPVSVQPQGAIATLQAGAIPWRVEIDGVPGTWKLLYSQDDLPVTRGKLVQFGGNTYRVSKKYKTMLHLSSQESECIA